MAGGERDKTCVSDVHLRSELFHECKDNFGVVTENWGDVHAGEKSTEGIDCRRVILEQVASFGDDGFASKSFAGKAREGGASPAMVGIVGVYRGNQRASVNYDDAP